MIRRYALTALSVLCLVSGLVAQKVPPRTLLVRIDSVTQDQLAKTGFITYDEYQARSLISLVHDTALVLLTPAESNVLRERGFRTTIVMEDTDEVNLVRRALYGPTMRLEKPYHTYDALMEEVAALERSFPARLRRFPIGVTNRGRTIYAVKIAKDVQKERARPAILFNGCHHSNEIAGAEICLGIIRELVTKYGTDAATTKWVDALEIYVVPVVNVDGHDIVTSGKDPRWRKNARDTDGNGMVNFPDGVDLNRTYDFNWAHGGAGEPGSGRYRGENPFSEPETRALAKLTREKRFLLSVTYHSQGEVIYYPWDWRGRKAPDDQLLTTIARGLAGSIQTMRGDTCYKAEYGAGLVGQSYPWMYGVLGTFDFVVETGKGAIMMPPGEIEGIVRANLNGARYMLEKGEGPGIEFHVIDAPTRSPVEAEVWFPSIETEDVHRRTTHPQFGTYRRLLLPGTYSAIISKDGYQPVVLNGITVQEKGWTLQTVELRRAKQ